MATTTTTTKPILLYVLPPREGHMRPALQITTYLTARGFDMTILSVPAWEPAIRAAGAHYAPLLGLWATLDNLTGPRSPWAPLLALAHDPAEMRRQLTAALSHKVLPTGLESVRLALTQIRHRLWSSSSSSSSSDFNSASWGEQGGGNNNNSKKTVIILSDTCFSGSLPLKLGADRPPGYEDISLRTVGIGVVPQFWASASRPPWGVGLPHDPSAAGVQRNLAAYADEWDQAAEDRARWVLEALNCDETLEELFARHDEEGVQAGIRHPFHDAYTVCHDVTLQLTLPSLELPARTPPHLKFAGALPLKPLSHWPNLTYPSWFDADVRQVHCAGDNHDNDKDHDKDTPKRKRVIVVAQGTETPDYEELVLPTLRGLADRDDLVVVAILCRPGAELLVETATEEDPLLGEGDGAEADENNNNKKPPQKKQPFLLPSNARVVDYFPYDAVLAHADLFVSASGYGGLTHAVAHGLPVLQTGRLLDKADIGRRVEYAGLGRYLPGRVGPADVAGAVAALLHDYPAFRARACALRDESLRYQPLHILEEEIWALFTKEE